MRRKRLTEEQIIGILKEVMTHSRSRSLSIASLRPGFLNGRPGGSEPFGGAARD